MHAGSKKKKKKKRKKKKTMSLGSQRARRSPIRVAEAEPAAAYQAARERMREGGAPAAIDRLSRLFHLSPFDEDVLLLALSAQLHGKPKQATAQVARSLFRPRER